MIPKLTFAVVSVTRKHSVALAVLHNLVRMSDYLARSLACLLELSKLRNMTISRRTPTTRSLK